MLFYCVEMDRTKSMSFRSIMTKFMSHQPYNKLEEGDVMYYELYVDSLFLVNFVMNLYVLLLVNRRLFRTATRKRLVAGAAVGAIGYLLPFFLPGPVLLRYVIGMIPGTLAMVFVVFRIKTVGGFLRVMEGVLMYSFLMGGFMVFLKRVLRLEQYLPGIWGILGVGALIYMVMSYRMEKKTQNRDFCKAVLIQNGNRITVNALVDSGNSLVEPISGKPVAIIEKDIAAKLWEKEPRFYRAIPYHSIGKKRGILKGYLLQEMQIETEGVLKVCRDVYVAVCEEYITQGHVKMILNPESLREEEKKKERVG